MFIDDPEKSVLLALGVLAMSFFPILSIILQMPVFSTINFHYYADIFWTGVKNKKQIEVITAVQNCVCAYKPN